jgi:betaine-aldehyde dehydrogenase
MKSWDRVFIGGDWVAPSTEATLPVVCPSTEEVIAHVPDAGPADMDRAVEAAAAAFEGDWPGLPMEERAAAVRRIAAALWPRLDEIAETITAEAGICISFARLGQAAGPLAMMDAYAGIAGQVQLEEEQTGMVTTSRILREPVGVVAAISPWNAPLYLAVCKLVPALLAGCTVVVKPSPEAPLDGYILAEAVAAAGLPPGVVNIVAGGREAGAHLVAHPAVDMVSFTGSTAAGRQIMATCAQRMKRVMLELGGKSAGIVLDDADLETAIPQLLGGALINNGEACAALTRILIPHSRHDEMVDALCAAVAATPVGDPFDESSAIGPMVTAQHRERVEGYIALGQEEGAKVALGGGRPPGQPRGWYVEPTVLVNVDNSMRVAREEIFGPVLSVIPYTDEDDAVRIANDSDFGLAGAVFTSDRGRGERIVRRLRAGTVTVNGFGLDPMIPYGGFRQSGIGREGGVEGIEAYLETKALFTPGA